MNYVSNEFQEKQQHGLMATMFGDSRKKGLDTVNSTASKFLVKDTIATST